MSKPLELTVYPRVDRWVDYTSEINGKTYTGTMREYGYETPRGVFEGDEWPEKRLTDAELAAEMHAANAAAWRAHSTKGSALPLLEDRFEILYRFAAFPHYDESQP